MSIHPRSHLPVSARHAFALAFDLALRRDALASLVVPLLLRAPFILIPAIVAPIEHPGLPRSLWLVSTGALVVDYLLLLLTSGMMRFRARSVFNTPPTVRPQPARICYASAAGRLPWLFVTEVVRNVALFLGTVVFFLLPGIYLGFKLSCATEAVVLDERNPVAAFGRSFRLTEGRFERWLEMVSISALIGLGLMLFIAVLSVLVPAPGLSFWIAVGQVMLTLVTAVIQYAWTFFYLRLVEIEFPEVEEGPLLAGDPAIRPRLVVLESEPSEGPERGVR